MKPRLGMTPQELVETFNETFLQSWGEVSEKLSLQFASQPGETDMAPLLLELVEAIANAARDSTVLTIYENNERLAQELQECGVELPGRRG